METAGGHGRVSGRGRGVGRVRGVSETRAVLARGSVPPGPVPACPRSFQPPSLLLSGLRCWARGCRGPACLCRLPSSRLLQAPQKDFHAGAGL